MTTATWNLVRPITAARCRRRAALFVAASLTLALLLAPIAAAAPILIDVGDRVSNGSSNTPTLGGKWNILTDSSNTSPVALVDANNVATGITIQNTAMFEIVDNGVPWLAGNSGWVDGNATSDFFATPAMGTSTITFSGLNPGGRYQFDVVAARQSDASNRIADYLVQGLFADSTPNGDNFHAYQDGFRDGDILSWLSVAPTAAGNITLTLQANPSVDSYGYLNAIRLQQVPEPSSMACVLLSVMALGLFVRRRRKQ